jgi:hypothetical protein
MMAGVLALLSTQLLLALPTDSLKGSCRATKQCCEGKDGACVVQSAEVNSISFEPDDAPCYCDHNCLNMGDCCNDFKDYCGGDIKLVYPLTWLKG